MKPLGQRIAISQKDEITMMKSWLTERGQEVPMDHGRGMMMVQGAMMEPMPSMLTPAQMAALGRQKTLSGTIRPRALVCIDQRAWREAPLYTLNGHRVLAVSGIADPRPFYEMLRAAEAELTGVLEYPDHYSYTSADWQRIVRSARNADMVVTTEKDLIKLERFPFVRDFLYALRLEVAMGKDEGRLLEMIIGDAQAPLAVHA